MIKNFASQARKVSGAVALGACAVVPAGALAAPQVPNANELYDWAQTALPAVFPGVQPTVSAPNFSFRGPYSTGNFVGVEGGKVYVLGPVTGNQLLAVGAIADFACHVHPSSCQATDALEKATAYLAKVNTQNATAATSGAQAFSNLDGCYLNNGVTKALEISRFDADSEVRAYYNRRVGSVRSETEVVGERRSTNSDGTARREIDVRYKVTYSNGQAVTVTETLIQGSSAGSAMPAGTCSTAQDSQDLRYFGNRRIVGAGVGSANVVIDRFKLADGTAQSQPKNYRSEFRINVTDPAGVATYAVISGPGIPSAYKLLSPRLLRSAPEFAGKTGNYVDWLDSDTFKVCRQPGSSGFAEASTANCVSDGATANTRQALGADAAAVDQAFTAFGHEAGGAYTFKVYNDDGWKSVNGQAGKTPIATYTARLSRLPVSNAALAAGGSSSYPEITYSLTPVQIAQMARAKSGGPLQATVARAGSVEGSGLLSWSSANYFVQGRTSASPTGSAFPGSRFFFDAIPTVGATSLSTSIPATPGAMTTPTYSEVGVIFDDQLGYSVRRVMAFE